DDRALRIAQRGEPAAEDGAGVDAQRVVQPLRVGYGRVAVDDRRLAAVLLRPRIAHRQAEFVGFTGALAIEAERAYAVGGAAVKPLREARMRHDETPLVEDVMRDQAVEEFL